MKRRLFGVPIALALLLGAAAWLRRGEPEPAAARAPRPAAAPGSPASEPSPPAPGAPPPAAAPKAPPTGALRVVIEGASVAGRLLVFGARERLDADRPAAPETLVAKLPAGPKNVVFLPSGPRLAAFAAAAVPAGGVAEVRLAPRPAEALAGTVVDVLQRPLPGVRVEIRRPPLFVPASRPPKSASLFYEEEAFGGRGGAAAVSRSTALEPDGSLRLGVTSAADGRFELEGVEPGALEAEISWKDVRFTQACVVGGENRIVVPGLPEAAVLDPTEEDARARVLAWLRQMALHPEAPEPYAAPLRAFLRERIAGLTLTARQRADLEARVAAIGKPAR